MTDFDTVLTRAMQLGQEKHPSAPAQHHASFANSVGYAVCALSGGYGGPSMREHWAGVLIRQAATPGDISFDQAVELVEGACYGPLTRDMAAMQDQECCFDDAPGEQELARQMLAAGLN